jgi:uncharacterized iron-regulated protein
MWAHRLVLLCLLMTTVAPRLATAQTARDAGVHPLDGRIWDTRALSFVEPVELARRLARARYVLLGEIHDNATTHRLHRDWLDALVAEGRRPAVAMEQFDREYQPALQRAQNEPGRTPESLERAGGSDTQGWDWSYYEPILRLALDRGLPIVAANLSRADAFRIAIDGAEAVLGAAAVGALGLDRPLPDAARRTLEAEIDDGHCGKAPRDLLTGLVAAQRARDAVMAETLQAHAPSVLIAGNGHVRRDFGVPLYLAQYPEGGDALVVGFVEVDTDRLQPADYVTADAPEYDYVAFTPPTPRSDPCDDVQFRPR